MDAADRRATRGAGEPDTDVTQPSREPSDTASSRADDTASDEPSRPRPPSRRKDPDKNNDQNDGDKGGDGQGRRATAQPVPQIPVYVFNQTSISGLAAETASSFESSGWNVVGVDNWVGNVPTDTVYFYPGDREAAERLSKDFPDIGRVWPASAPMPAGALTVILADAARK